MKKMFSIFLCAVMLVTTMATPALASNNLEDVLAVQGIEMLEFNPETENVLDALYRADVPIDLTDAVVIERMDVFGNTYFVVETAMIEVNYYNEVTLAELAYVFLNDPEANAQLLGNTLTYTLPDGTEGMITEIVDRHGIRTLEVIEGEIRNEIVFDSANEQVLVDGETVTVSQSKEIVIQQFDGVERWTNWTFLMTVDTNIRTPQAVRNMAVATLAALISARLVGTAATITTAGIIICFFRDLRPYHPEVYARRRMYRDNDWVFFQYVDSFYTWNARTATQRITTVTAVVLG